MPKISVVMPVYNTKEEYLREAIESILNQTYTDFEFIILNDGSTNNVEEVILSYKDLRIRYFFHKNQGMSFTLNKGINLAKGEFIARMDSDDISLPHRFEKQIQYFKDNPKLSIIGAWIENFPKRKIIHYLEHPFYLDLCSLGCPLAHPTVMFKKDFFLQNNLHYDPKYLHAQDFDLWSRAIKVAKFANIQEVLLKYRWHEENMSVVHKKNQAEEALKIQNSLFKALIESKALKEKVAQEYYSLRHPRKKRVSLLKQLFSISKNSKYKYIKILGFTVRIKNY